MDPSYKRIDTIPKLLEYMWSIFPNIVAVKRGELQPMDMKAILDKKMYGPAIENSVEFCDLMANNILKVKSFTQGGFGTVGTLTIDEDGRNQPLKAIVLSLRRAGGFEPFYVSVIIKLYLTVEKPRWAIGLTEADRGFFYISDPISEMIFGSMLGHLYDLGICPFFTKYFGAYICKSDKTSIVTERASIELRRLISRDPLGVAQKHPDVLVNILAQYVYALYIMKYYFGMVHFDTQQRNIMVTYIHNRQVKLNEPVQPYIYHGESLAEKDFILMQTHLTGSAVGGEEDLPVFVCLKNCGLLVKVIDYGVCVSHLNRSRSADYKNDIAISSTQDDLSRIGALEAFQKTLGETPSAEAYSNSVDLMYTLINVWEHMTKGLDRHTGHSEPDPASREAFREALRQVHIFSERFFGESIESYLHRNPQNKVQLFRGGLEWVSRGHDAGITRPTFARPERLLEGLVNVCGSSQVIRTTLSFNNVMGDAYVYHLESDLYELIKRRGLNNTNTLLLMSKPSDKELAMNLFSNYVSSVNSVRDTCSLSYSPSPDRVVKCEQLMSDVEKHSLQSLSPKRLYAPTAQTLRTALQGDRLRLSLLDLPETALVKRTPLFDYWQLQLNPAALKLNRDINGAQVYQEYQSWFDFQTVKESKIGEYVETVFLHIFKLGLPRSTFIDKGVDLWTGAQHHLKTAQQGITFNGGYFIVPGNINYLNPQLSREDRLQPIGFSYSNRHYNNGTRLSFPSTYNSDLGVVYGRSDGSVFVEEFAQFLSKHQLLSDTVRLETKEKQVITETVPAIAMISNTGMKGEEEELGLLGGRPLKVDGTEVSDDDYTWAFCSGPFLIREGVVVFTEQKMNTELMVHGDKLVHAVPNARNSYKYRAAPAEANQFYGMRHSHRYMVHNILAVDYSQNLFCILCEGRGFDSPGLDRVQLAYLLSAFNLRTALSLDGGFSANAIFKDCSSDCRPVFALSEPEKRELGVSVYMVS